MKREKVTASAAQRAVAAGGAQSAGRYRTAQTPPKIANAVCPFIIPHSQTAFEKIE